MKKKFLACGLAACAALVALALPTKKEVQAARPIVAELMADAVAEQKAGKIKTAELGARALALADRAETEAARLLLLQGAVIAFARGGEPARAAEAVRKMRGEIKGITPEYEADMLSRAVKSLPLKDGRLLYGMLDDARRLVRYRREAATLEKSLAAKDDPAKRAQLAERLAALGEWKRALEEIAKLGGDVARAAKFELGEGTMTSAEVAEFWWRQSGMKDADGFTVYQRHAGEWYAKALADGSLTGLKRDLAQKRIDDMGGIKNFRGSGTVASGTRAASGHRGSGVPAAVASDWRLPASFTPPLEKTLTLPSGEQITFAACPAGTFQMSNGTMPISGGPPSGYHKVTITHPFWISKKMVTARKLKGFIPAGKQATADKVAREFPDKEVVIATPLEYNVTGRFCDALNRQQASILPPSYVFRLPSEAELEYAWRAGEELPQATLGSVRLTTEAFAAKGWIQQGVSIYKLPGEYEGMSLHLRNFIGNAWGIGNSHWMRYQTLDRVRKQDNKRIDDIVYASAETDPVRTYDKPDWVWVTRQNYFRFGDRFGRVLFHLVIGPDLLKGRGITPPKLGK